MSVSLSTGERAWKHQTLIAEAWNQRKATMWAPNPNNWVPRINLPLRTPMGASWTLQGIVRTQRLQSSLDDENVKAMSLGIVITGVWGNVGTLRASERAAPLRSACHDSEVKKVFASALSLTDLSYRLTLSQGKFSITEGKLSSRKGREKKKVLKHGNLEENRAKNCQEQHRGSAKV